MSGIGCNQSFLPCLIFAVLFLTELQLRPSPSENLCSSGAHSVGSWTDGIKIRSRHVLISVLDVVASWVVALSSQRRSSSRRRRRSWSGHSGRQLLHDLRTLPVQHRRTSPHLHAAALGRRRPAAPHRRARPGREAGELPAIARKNDRGFPGPRH